MTGATEPTTTNPIPESDYEFALCLTHDIDRPYKGLQSLFYAVTDRRPHHLFDLRPGAEPWWQFHRLMNLEDDLGVRSAFYFLQEQHLLRDRNSSEWLEPRFWIEHLGRYDPTNPDIAAIIDELDRRDWEVGLHGSIGTHRDVQRLAMEKSTLEDVLGHEIIGGRQHHLELDVPDTWRRHVSVGLQYDTSLGSASTVGFDNGYGLQRPFDDEFVEFPLTIMDKALDTQTDGFDDAWARCRDLLATARDNDAVMTILWHLRNFNERDYPGQSRLYRRLIERALEMGAWVGSPGDFYETFELDSTVAEEQQSVV